MNDPISLSMLQDLIASQREDISALKEEIYVLKTLHQKAIPVAADASQYFPLQPKRSIHTLNLPLTQVVDLYLEMPQALTAYACRAALVKAQGENIIIEHNDLGNYWVIQIKKQGYFLFPRPNDFKRQALLMSLEAAFRFENHQPENLEFSLKTPGKLQVRHVEKKWQLEEKGELVFGRSPLQFQWQQELAEIKQLQKDFNQLLNRYGEAALDFTELSRGWQQSLTRRYGEVITIVINTCMPIAYAIYKGPVLVPCQVMLSSLPLILPGWDRGIDWEQSFYGKIHSKHNRDYLTTSNNHPLLPNQIYLKEIEGKNNHTWAIAKSYDEATTIVQRLRGNWQSLENQ